MLIASFCLERDFGSTDAFKEVVDGKFDTIEKCRYRLKKKKVEKEYFFCDKRPNTMR